MNKVIMMGRMVADAELKTTPSGVSACKFRIAVDRNYQKKGEEKKADFFNCAAWRGTAEFISKWFPKGRLILIEGEMQISQYTDKKTGNPATWYEIQVENAYFTGDKGNGGGGGGNYGAPPISEPPAGYGGGYSSSAPAQSAPDAPAGNAPAADFSAADSDDYPF